MSIYLFLYYCVGYYVAGVMNSTEPKQQSFLGFIFEMFFAVNFWPVLLIISIYSKVKFKFRIRKTRHANR